MAENDLKSLKNSAQKELNGARNLKELKQVFKKYLGKKGKISLILRSLKNKSNRERKELGKEANELKDFLKTP